MKKITALLLSALLSIMLISHAAAESVTYLDNYANWPNWPKFPYAVNPSDTIGTFPTISSLTVNSSGGYLQSIVVAITNLRGSETLFINSVL